MSSPMISIICNTYNHEKYIEQTLKGFVNQKTTYPYEILIHDDASTDRTAEIIRRYADAYPSLFKPIYQTENQYSQGINVSGVYQYSRAKRKYIAFCEGDDYWCDPEKLQKQVDFLERHPAYSACVHQTQVIDDDGEKKGLFSPIDKTCDIEELNEYMDFPHTSSFLLRNPFIDDTRRGKYLQKYISYWDKSMVIYMFRTGKIHYLADIMSCYRCVTDKGTSFQARMKSKNMTKEIVDAELCHYRQLRAYRMDVDIANHYFRNVNLYALKKWLHYPSVGNFKLMVYGIRKCPFQKRKMIRFFWNKLKICTVNITGMVINKLWKTKAKAEKE